MSTKEELELLTDEELEKLLKDKTHHAVMRE